MISFNTNLDARVAVANLNAAKETVAQSIMRLTTGLRINTASDDPAGLAISTKFEAQIRSLGQAMRNTNDAVSLVQTADGGYETIAESLSRMREMAVESANSSMSATDRANLNIQYAAWFSL